jgi:hypothetical protein
MKQFWQYVQANPRTISQPTERSAYVLPQDFGYGFRGPRDTIFGLWNASWDGTTSLNFVADIGMCVYTFLKMFGTNLDIIYPGGNQTPESLGYKNVIYWNDTSMAPNMPAMPPQKPAVSTYTLPLTASPQQGASQNTYFTTIELYTIAVCILIAIAVAGVLLRFRRRQSSE